MSHKVTIKVSPDSLEAEVRTSDPQQEAYIKKYLTRANIQTPVKVHVTAEVHRVLSLMVMAQASTGATIGGYLTAIVLDHFAKNADLMKRIFEDSREELF
ncbi:MAG: DUF3408 domain-containing protein [Muribaculum sp.]|nr:DUF3408 domain-containing protein [Muribaculum sp.]